MTREDAPVRDAGTAAHHSVQFYDRDDYLIGRLERFAAEGLESGAAVIAIATGAHLAELESRLAARGIDVAAAGSRAQYVALDAVEMLERISVAGVPDSAAFERVVGTLVAGTRTKYAEVRAFGEMVALLCESGRYGAAVRLEGFWNDLCARHPIALLCAYPIDVFGDESSRTAFSEVCAAHGEVAPTEDYLRLDEDERLRLVGELQRRARSLEREIGHRAALAGQLATRERELADFLENSERRTRGELEVWKVLRRTGIAFASELDASRLAQHATDAAVELTGAAFGVFYPRSDETPLACSPSDAPLADAASLRACEPIASAFRDLCTARVGDLALAGEPERLGVRSALAVPVVSRSDRMHGVLVFGHAEPGAFGEREEMLVEGLAAQVATAMDNALLFEANARAREELRHLNEVLEQRVTERTEALRRSEFQLQLLVSGIADCAIFMLDRNGHVVTWNTGAERIKGYSKSEIVGQHFSRFFTEEDRAAGVPQRALERAAERGKNETEGWRVRKDGSKFWASVLLDAIRDESGRLIGFAKVTRDMTERKAMEEHIRQSQKIEAVGQLTGGVAHDFNNLLTVILGNLEVIVRRAGEDAKLRHAAEQAMRGAQRAATLTQQLLAFSRRQPLNPQPTDVNRLVGGMSDLLRRTLSESIAIETVLAGGLWRVEVDAHQLESALLNLAVNARDAMRDGGKLTVETSNVRVDARNRRAFPDLSEGEYVLISVTDTGCGMDADVAQRAFEPFFTTKPVGQGTGLGLSQVYGFVRQSGGHVTIWSEPGKGTSVRIHLPRLDREIEHADASEAADPLPGGHETILVVEDDEQVRAYSAHALRELGFLVLEAPDGPTGLEMLDRHADIQLLFTDIGLPGLDGRQLVELARQRRPDLKALFTTAYARNAVAQRGGLAAGTGLLPKPFTRAQLAQAVREVLDAKIRGRGARVAVALVVGEEPLMRSLAAYMLKEIGYRVVEAATREEALAIADASAEFDVALVDVESAESCADLARRLRASWPRLPIVLTGRGERIAEGWGEDRRVAAIGKPYDVRGLTLALSKAGAALRRQSAPAPA